MAVYRAGRSSANSASPSASVASGPNSAPATAGCPKAFTQSAHIIPTALTHLSLRISYPSPDDELAARDRGVNPGGDIIDPRASDGRGWIGSRHRLADWTDGCIAVTNPEMEWLYRAVPTAPR